MFLGCQLDGVQLDGAHGTVVGPAVVDGAELGDDELERWLRDRGGDVRVVPAALGPKPPPDPARNRRPTLNWMDRP